MIGARAECERMRIQGIDECIGILSSRRAHYECYRTGDAMTTHPATSAVIDELLVFMQAHRERVNRPSIADARDQFDVRDLGIPDPEAP